MQNPSTNQIVHCNSIDGMESLPEECIPLTVTTPPYRRNGISGGGYDFEVFKAMARQLARITMLGGVICWVVRNQIHKGGENCRAEKEKLFFVEECGMLANHTIIGIPTGSPLVNPTNRRYANNADFIYVFSKGRPHTVNLIRDRRNKGAGTPCRGRLIRNPNGTERKGSVGSGITPRWGLRTNVWNYSGTSSDSVSRLHPARMPESLAEDLIVSFSNPNDLVFDPMAGAGTTLKMAMLNNRQYLGMEINQQYVELIRQRLKFAQSEKQE